MALFANEKARTLKPKKVAARGNDLKPLVRSHPEGFFAEDLHCLECGIGKTLKPC